MRAGKLCTFLIPLHFIYICTYYIYSTTACRHLFGKSHQRHNDVCSCAACVASAHSSDSARLCVHKTHRKHKYYGYFTSKQCKNIVKLSSLSFWSVCPYFTFIHACTFCTHRKDGECSACRRHRRSYPTTDQRHTGGAALIRFKGRDAPTLQPRCTSTSTPQTQQTHSTHHI